MPSAGPVQSVRYDVIPRPPGSRPAPDESFDDETLACLHPVTAELARYWKSKCKAGGFPSRSDIDPIDLRGILSHIVLFDVVPQVSGQGAYRYKFRLVGNETMAVLGNVTGRFLDEVLPAASQVRTIGVLDRAVTGRKPLRNVGRVHIPRFDYCVSEAICLPLAEGDVINMAIGASVLWPEDSPPATVLKALQDQA